MCVLRVQGKYFDVEAWLRTSGFSNARATSRGSVDRRGRVLDESYLVVDVSRPDWPDLATQARDAIDFLDNYLSDLTRLAADPQVERLQLDFAVENKIASGEVLAQYVVLPSALIERMAKFRMDVEISIYAVADDESEPT